jgi:diphthamide synthase (EF-2-diphthine--ammonia ligase)
LRVAEKIVARYRTTWVNILGRGVEEVSMILGSFPHGKDPQAIRKVAPLRYVQDMIDARVDAILVKVAGLGLSPKKHLGKTLVEMQAHLERLQAQHGTNACGEGGEFETITLNCPAFTCGRIVLEVCSN